MDEKQRILKLLNDHLITIEEAEMLLKGLDNHNPEQNDPKYTYSKTINIGKELEQFGEQFAKLVKESLKSIEVKMDDLFKKEPKNENE